MCSPDLFCLCTNSQSLLGTVKATSTPCFLPIFLRLRFMYGSTAGKGSLSNTSPRHIPTISSTYLLVSSRSNAKQTSRQLALIRGSPFLTLVPFLVHSSFCISKFTDLPKPTLLIHAMWPFNFFPTILCSSVGSMLACQTKGCRSDPWLRTTAILGR